MKRKVPGLVSLTWTKNTTTGYLELIVDGMDENDGCMARVMQEEYQWEDEPPSYHFAIWRPKEGAEKREHQMYGYASSAKEAVRLAEVAIDNRSWWRSKKLSIDRSALDKPKIERKKVTRR